MADLDREALGIWFKNCSTPTTRIEDEEFSPIQLASALGIALPTDSTKSTEVVPVVNEDTAVPQLSPLHLAAHGAHIEQLKALCAVPLATVNIRDQVMRLTCNNE